LNGRVPHDDIFFYHVANYGAADTDSNRISYHSVSLHQVMVPQADSDPEIVFSRIGITVPTDEIVSDAIVVAADKHSADVQRYELDSSTTVRDIAVLDHNVLFEVDFRDLARRYEVSGGDIRNAVLKAALAAAAELGPDSAKRIHQRHLEASIEDVIAGKRVMRQSLFADEERAVADANFVESAAGAHASRLLTYALAGACVALIVAVIALTVALLR